ncbi:unnamed protein product [Ambrosiozyma monospora]|uniref:Sulfhydryl oxidase n=1 Tax=Ambrosiozyma monospora TaxID=43982 RepID=A0A9W6YST8_AMBMO|nr:unnamed protein product [Ambrosiozyma monospora]
MTNVLLRRYPRMGSTTLVAAVIIFLFYTISSSLSSTKTLSDPTPITSKNVEDVAIAEPNLQLNNQKSPSLQQSYEEGEVDTPFMPKMGNATLRAELGNASWKLFHTILARYPDNPTPQERQHLDTYIASFSQVYPCGDCARHFVKLLKKYPPQLHSRKTAALWGCHVHNKVNKVLKHPEYDCTNILEDYDCGCGVDEETDDYTLGGKSMKEQNEAKEHLNSIKVESTEERVHG